MLGGSNSNGAFPPFFRSSVSESLDHILFFDASGNPLSNVTFTVEVPEPAAWSLLSIGLIFFLAVAIRGRYPRMRATIICLRFRNSRSTFPSSYNLHELFT